MNTYENSSIKKGNHFHRYSEYATGLISKYNGNEPFHLYLKKYFSFNKKHGSKDRKLITSLCYNYFRLGFGVSKNIEITEKIVFATFLIEKNPSLFLESLRPEWNKKIHLSISEKLEMSKNIFDVEKIFPLKDELSDEIAFEKFSLAFLIQPKLFIRIRPGCKTTVIDKLKSANISFEKINENCLSFSNNEKVSSVIKIDKEAVIQDYNSQRTGEFLTSYITHNTSCISLWDCCAASGGKSILAYDLLKNAELTVSDTRKNILKNLHSRFSKASIKNYHSFITDLPALPPLKQVGGRLFDLIIADVPCSGSGTWSRTPDQLHFFQKKNIEKYAKLQQKIVTNAIRYLNEDGYLLYITCSVFEKENEENIAFIQKKLGLELLECRYLKGCEMKSDTLFAAIFKKNPDKLSI
ncbi:MAG: Fmu (Sun) domain-containing protein [Bacteroidota bacterium]|nr:Fmu (Sun) domain-containing protein [Bacteroidota bacterium]